jgi:peptide chain release factor 2
MLYEDAPSLQESTNKLEVQMMLSGEHDGANAIVSIHPGAGGTESQDWASMLYRMYLRWAERHGFKVEGLDYQAGEEAGIKDVSFIIKGENAYGYLKVENGIHRLVRISPFDSNAKRHTSFYLPCKWSWWTTCQQNRISHPSHTYRNKHYRAVSK